MVTILHDMVKKGLMAQSGGSWTLAVGLEDVDPSVPETLDQLIEAQFQLLSAPEQRVLKSASVAGERFSVWAIAPPPNSTPASLKIFAKDSQRDCNSSGLLGFMSWPTARFPLTTTSATHFTAKFCTGGSPRLPGQNCTCSWHKGSKHFAIPVNKNWPINLPCISKADATTSRQCAISY